MSLRSQMPRCAPSSYLWGPSIGRQNDQGIVSLFSLLDDITSGDLIRQPTTPKQSTASKGRFFAPRFDAREEKDLYLLEGELPGMDQKNLSIEFTDDHTLVISGSHSESTRESSGHDASTDSPAPEPQSHHATVEDEAQSSSTTPAPSGGEVTKSANNNDSQIQTHTPTYWLSERTTSGTFSRTFNFPARINQDSVSANLKNGVLTVTVPKAPAPESRKIEIN